MNNNNTHLIENIKDQDTSVLSRMADGTIIAAREGKVVAWGLDPRKQDQRVFRTSAFAQSFLRSMADVDRREEIGTPQAVARLEEIEIDMPWPSSRGQKQGRII